MPKKQSASRSSKRSPSEKLRLLNESSSLEGEELGAFLRKEGLYDSDLEEMRQAALAGLAPKPVKRGKSPEAKQIAKLERELRKKEKALAEAAALLVLQKKFQALMADEGDDTQDIFGDDSCS